MDEALDVVVHNWQTMQSSDPDDAGEDAERFEQSFYRFIDVVAAFLTDHAKRPKGLEEALDIPEISALRERIPAPLQLNFDTEVEDLCTARTVMEDDA